MKPVIYYFSSTGNSLVLARDAASRLDGTLVDISTTRDETYVFTSAPVIGLVFPVYHASFGEPGIPYAVHDFISRMRGLKDSYIFALVSHAGTPGFTLENLNGLLEREGGRLKAGGAVRMAVPYSTRDKISHYFLNREIISSDERDTAKRQELIKAYEKSISSSRFYERVLQGEEMGFYRTPMVKKTFLKSFFRLQRKAALKRYRELAHFGGDDFRELTRFADRSFEVSDLCNACGTCANVCPVGNIEMDENKPRWLHSCENCFACYQWCPQGAIGGKICEYEKRSHHESINLKDMLHDGSA